MVMMIIQQHKNFLQPAAFHSKRSSTISCGSLFSLYTVFVLSCPLRRIVFFNSSLNPKIKNKSSLGVKIFVFFCCPAQIDSNHCFAGFFFNHDEHRVCMKSHSRLQTSSTELFTKHKKLGLSTYHTICKSFIQPLEFAATTILDFPLQKTLETKCPLSSTVSWPGTGSKEPNLWEVIGIGRDR